MFRDLLVKDEALERTLGAVHSPRLRRLLLWGTGCLCLVLLYLFTLERDVSRFFYLIIAGGTTFGCVTQFVKERAIVQHLGKAVGTVYVFEKHDGGRNVVRFIKYAFLSAEHRVFIGRSRIGLSAGINGTGQTLCVLYNLEDPSVNLPLANFWLCKFSDAAGGRPFLSNSF